MLGRVLASILFCISSITFADALPDTPILDQPHPLITPQPPTLNAKAWLLIDADSGKMIAGKNIEEKLPPASLTKMMTLYVISKALKTGQLRLSDKVHISRDAWKMEGSRMFVKEGSDVSVEELLKGIIVDSGNDACAAMAEHLGGSETGFANIMNAEAKALGMSDSHFTDSTGLPAHNLFTTAKDLAILGRALVNNFPEYYHWYQQKWFEYNGIRQANRNRLLWRDNQVDGIKTGHTNEAGYCLVASAKRKNMRLVSVILHAPTENSRADDSERLLNYGFRFYETYPIYKAKETILSIPVYKGKSNRIKVGFLNTPYITIPKGQYQLLNLTTKTVKDLTAPVQMGDKVGELQVILNNALIGRYPLYALENSASGGFFTRFYDSIRLFFIRWWRGKNAIG